MDTVFTAGKDYMWGGSAAAAAVGVRCDPCGRCLHDACRSLVSPEELACRKWDGPGAATARNLVRSIRVVRF